jgi:hypothetical protein
LQHVVEVLRSTYGPLRFYLNHCTGEGAYLALASGFPRRGPIGGAQVNPCPVGTILTFD